MEGAAKDRNSQPYKRMHVYENIRTLNKIDIHFVYIHRNGRNIYFEVKDIPALMHRLIEIYVRSQGKEGEKLFKTVMRSCIEKLEEVRKEVDILAHDKLLF